MKEEIRSALMNAGASAVGFASAHDSCAEFSELYSRWIKAGKHAGMDYLERHLPLKGNPANVLENAKTVISMAFSYAPSSMRDTFLPMIACYAYGKDYHDVIRKRLRPIVARLEERYGGEWRICIDSAPLPERFWAMRCGIGRIGKNGSVIVDGCGSWCFLAEILTTKEIAPDMSSAKTCLNCGACIKACPLSAISEDGTIDSGRCLNYLTIEHRGEWSGARLEAMQTPAGKKCLYGCDICHRVCPHNSGVTPTEIEEFKPLQGIMTIDAGEIAHMTQEEFSTTFKGSAIKRAKLEGMKRNAMNIDRLPDI